MGVGFLHRAGRYRPGGSLFRSMQGFLIWGWVSIFPSVADSRSHSLSVISRWGRGFYTVRGGVDAKDRRFHPRLVVEIDLQGFLNC